MSVPIQQKPPGDHKGNPFAMPLAEEAKVVPGAKTGAEAQKKIKTVAKKSLEEFKEDLAAPRKSLGARIWNWIKENIFLAIARLFGYRKKDNNEDDNSVSSTDRKEVDLLKEQLDELIENEVDPKEWNAFIDNLFKLERKAQIKTVRSNIIKERDRIEASKARIETSEAKIQEDEDKLEVDQEKIDTEKASIAADEAKIVPVDEQEEKDEAIASRKEKLGEDEKKLKAAETALQKAKNRVKTQKENIQKEETKLKSDNRKLSNDYLKIQRARLPNQPIKFEALNIQIDDFEALKGKMRLELMDQIANNPDMKVAFDPIIERIGGVLDTSGPAKLKNNNKDSCYMDSLLQLFFASKAFVTYLKTVDPVPPSAVVTALKNYAKAIEAGIGGTSDINNYRNDILNAIAEVPGIGNKIQVGPFQQQDITEVLGLIYSELNPSEVSGLTHTIVRNGGNNFSKTDSLSNPILPWSSVKLELSVDQKIGAAGVKQHEINELNRLGLGTIAQGRNVEKDWEDRLNAKSSISLQDLLNEFFQEKTEHINGVEYKETNQLGGVAPPVLFIPLRRVIPGATGGEEFNKRKITIPDGEEVTLPVGGENVKYRVVGVAGGRVSAINGGHYVANVIDKDGEWHFTNDLGVVDEKLTSANALGENNKGSYDMSTHSYLYILERVEEPIPEQPA